MTEPISPNKFALSIKEAQAAAPVGRQGIYDAINEGQLRAKKNGRRTLILIEDFKAWLAGLPEYDGKAA